jgi:hypothetical protein
VSLPVSFHLSGIQALRTTKTFCEWLETSDVCVHLVTFTHKDPHQPPCRRHVCREPHTIINTFALAVSYIACSARSLLQSGYRAPSPLPRFRRPGMARSGRRSVSTPWYPGFQADNAGIRRIREIRDKDRVLGYAKWDCQSHTSQGMVGNLPFIPVNSRHTYDAYGLGRTLYPH